MGNGLSEEAELYQRMQMEMLNTARGWRSGRVQPEDLWDAAFRDGFYERLSENTGLAFDFLVVTERGPTWHYKKYLNIIQTSDDLLALIALSALVNDALH
jgi:hypothetical protein